MTEQTIVLRPSLAISEKKPNVSLALKKKKKVAEIVNFHACNYLTNYI